MLYLHQRPYTDVVPGFLDFENKLKNFASDKGHFQYFELVTVKCLFLSGTLSSLFFFKDVGLFGQIGLVPIYTFRMP